MNRISFLKRILTGAAGVAVAPQLLASPTPKPKEEFTFDELFSVWEGNKNLVYPKKDSAFYKEIESIFSNRINEKGGVTYFPVHRLSLSVKPTYTWQDFLPLKYYFECVYEKDSHYALENGVTFRFFKNAPDRMHLVVFGYYPLTFKNTIWNS